MASQDNGQSRPSRRDAETGTDAPEATEVAEGAERREKLGDDVDALLDEIDDVLESNAEDFVKSFVQKGGQ